MDTSEATAEGGEAEAARQREPCLVQLRTVYVGGRGIVAAPSAPLLWNGAKALGIGRRSSAPSAESWLAIEDDRVSRQHARLTRRGDSLILEDLHSRNGTWRNGAVVPPATPIACWWSVRG